MGHNVEVADVVVLGAGAAGLAATVAARAEGASVALLDSGSTVGGTAALSAGVIWIPCNHHARESGITDNAELALTYVQTLSNGRIDEPLAAAYIDDAPLALAWLEANTPLRYGLIGYPDYHSENSGALAKGGRSLEPMMFSFRQLGDWAQLIACSPSQQARLRLNASETPYGGYGARPAPTSDEVARRTANDERGWGQALVGALLKAVLDVGVVPRLETRARRVIREGRDIVGVVATRPDGDEVELRARRGVVIATGGFDGNDEAKRAYLRGPLTHSVAVATNVGDGLRLAQDSGAALGCMQEAFWAPVINRPGQVTWNEQTFPRASVVVFERSRPGSIIVNRAGRRFCNEATNYNAIVGAFHAVDPNSLSFANLPAFLIFDDEFKRREIVSDVRPDDAPPAWMPTATTLDDLAATLGIDGPTLALTVERFNSFVEGGHDDDYQRGESSFERSNGYLDRPGALANLGAVRTPPFYAIELAPGAFGTRGGPRTDRNGRVIDLDGNVIGGLYAAGNAMASVFEMAYPGGGATLGPALTYGVLAGRHAARRRTDA